MDPRGVVWPKSSGAWSRDGGRVGSAKYGPKKRRLDTQYPVKITMRGEDNSSPFLKNMTKINLILKQIENNSRRPVENRFLLKKYIQQSLKQEKDITFYAWECPPRVVDVDKNGRAFINYCVNLEKVFQGKKIDKYTEIPQVIKSMRLENKMLRLFKSLGLNFRFIKIIADTNAYYLTPLSIKVLGRKRIKSAFVDFKNKLKNIIDNNYSVKPKAYLFSDVLVGFRGRYNRYFSRVLDDLKSKEKVIIPFRIWNNELAYLKRHMGLKGFSKEGVEDLAKRVVASYAAEGMVFDLLSQKEEFSNCVWLNIPECSEEAITITNCLREKEGIGKMPMIFP